MYHRPYPNFPDPIPAGVKSNRVVWLEVALVFLALVALYAAFFYSIG